jgi:peptidoglycan/LPS O-acetylase OafA/YrhL
MHPAAQTRQGIRRNAAPKKEHAWDKLRNRLSNVSLRRITTQAKLIPQIDGLRFVAIALVLVEHIVTQGGVAMHAGGLLWALDRRVVGLRAVYLFFGLSGFILALPFARQYLQDDRAVDLRAYFLRRLTRLEPPYIVAMLLRLFAFLVASTIPLGTLCVHFLVSLFYLHTAVYGRALSINQPAWSLEIEVQFYIVAPLLALLFRIRPTWLRRVVLVTLIVALSFFAHLHVLVMHERLYRSLICNLQYFLAGYLTCDLYVMRDFHEARNWLWDAGGIGGILYIAWVTDWWSRIGYPVAIMVICLAAFYGHVLPRLLALPWVCVIGGMCYSIYLTHNSVLTAVHSVMRHLPGLAKHWAISNAVVFLLAIAGTLFVGAVFFVLVERPFMDPLWPSKVKAWFTARQPPRQVRA